MVYKIYDYDAFKVAIEEICARLSLAVCAEKVFDCRLICSELIANVLQHSGGWAQLQVKVLKRQVKIGVKAEIPFCPPKGECPQISEERGRGIYLIDSLCAERTFTDDGEIVVKVSI